MDKVRKYLFSGRRWRRPNPPPRVAGTKQRKLVWGLTLVEILIVIAILGIIAAIVVPNVIEASQQTKEAAAKDNLRILRSAIEQYAAQHNGVPPGYINGSITGSLSLTAFTQQLCRATTSNGAIADIGTPGYPLGPYLPEIPKNPFNNYNNITILGNNGSFPPSATDSTGWICKPLTKTIRLNSPGTDSQGINYYDY